VARIDPPLDHLNQARLRVQANAGKTRRTFASLRSGPVKCLRRCVGGLTFGPQSVGPPANERKAGEVLIPPHPILAAPEARSALRGLSQTRPQGPLAPILRPFLRPLAHARRGGGHGLPIWVGWKEPARLSTGGEHESGRRRPLPQDRCLPGSSVCPSRDFRKRAYKSGLPVTVSHGDLSGTVCGRGERGSHHSQKPWRSPQGLRDGDLLWSARRCRPRPTLAPCRIRERRLPEEILDARRAGAANAPAQAACRLLDSSRQP
jgi:hypothetical protein